MTYTTLTCNGVEKPLADWGISSHSRRALSQSGDEFTCTVQAPMDAVDVFPWGVLIQLKIGRATSRLNPVNPTLPASGAAGFSGGTQFFWGYCAQNDRTGTPDGEQHVYKFVGPYQFFGEVTFQKLKLTWNGLKQVADWQSNVTLGLSLSTLTGPTDTVPGTTATNLMSLSQQIKEILAYMLNDSVYQQANPDFYKYSDAIATWPAGAQFQCDALTRAVDGVNWYFLDTPSANTLIRDYYGIALSNKTSAVASDLLAIPGQATAYPGTYILRAPLDAVCGTSCMDCIERMLQALGGVGSPVVWTDHSQSPPMLKLATRDQLTPVSIPLAGNLTGTNSIKERVDLAPPAVHLKFLVSGSFNGQTKAQTFHDVAAYIDGVLQEGIGEVGALYDVNNPETLLADDIQTTLMALAKTKGSIVKEENFQGSVSGSVSATLDAQVLPLADPNGTPGGGGAWTALFPELADILAVKFYNGGNPGITIKDNNGNVLYQNGAWTGTTYLYWVRQGQVTPGMIASRTSSADPDGGATIDATISVAFAYQQLSVGPAGKTANGESISYDPKTRDITLTNVPGGTYVTSGTSVYAEPLPFGLAGVLMELESIPQYQGKIKLQETEITDGAPLGSLLNITGGRAEWATMNAVVQEIVYNDDGSTEISFGPARHLNAGQFIARMRANQGPRVYNLMSSDPMNGATGQTELGKNLPRQATTKGQPVTSFKSFFTNPLSVQNTPATLQSGFFIDTGAGVGSVPTNFATGAVPTGELAFPAHGSKGFIIADGPTIVGSAVTVKGESNCWVRCLVEDLKTVGGALQLVTPNGNQPPLIRFREEEASKKINGVCTDGYRLVWESQFYTQSIRATPDA